MKVFIVYDSFFGNTEKIAQAIGKGIGPQVEVKLFRIADIQLESLVGVNVFIVGSPTRNFRPTPALRDFLKSIPDNGLKGVRVAAFDTGIAPQDLKNRVSALFIKLFGYAAKPIADLLQKKGGEQILPPQGFYVKVVEGPLKAGELERAEQWGKQLNL
jgi:flavodoxin I